MQGPHGSLVSEDVVKALVDPTHPSSDPVVQLLSVAMSGFGYNFYDARNVARSNDQIVRERIGDELGRAARALADFERRFRERSVPAATRDAPFPPPEVLRRLRAIDALRKRCEAAISAVGGAETPATDAIWFRVRSESDTLYRLIAFDVSLATGAERILAAAEALDVANVDDASLDALDGELSALESAFNRRRTLLTG